jgi:mRNA interferase MazF
MKQGEIWSADLNPVKGSEQAGFRPVAIISGNLLNQHLPVVIVVPLTTKIKNYKGNPILKPSSVNGLKSESEMLIFHIRSVSKDRLVEKLGDADASDVALAVKTLQDILKF